MQMFDLTEAVLVDHDNTSQMRANTALMSIGVSSAATGEALVVAPMGAASKAKTWVEKALVGYQSARDERLARLAQPRRGHGQALTQGLL
jgi:hypothetical protein